MAKLLLAVREHIGDIAFDIFLWSRKLKKDEYIKQIVNDSMRDIQNKMAKRIVMQIEQDARDVFLHATSKR